MKPSIFVTRKLPEAVMQRLDEYFEVEVNPDDRVLEKHEIIAGIEGKDALLCLLTDAIDEEVLQANKGLKVVSNYAVGFNNINVNAATELGIPVTITPGVLTETSADLTWALMMAVSRRVIEGDQMMRDGEFHGWGPLMLLGGDVYGKTLGIVGAGRIGQAVARRATGFKMRVLYSANSQKPEFEAETGAQKADLDQILRESDFVSLHVPLSQNTTHLIGAAELQKMKSTAYLINTARGPVVDEKALVEALRSGVIRGAGLDVYEKEPQMAPGLAELPNTVLLPHVGSATIETRTAMGMLAAENAIAIFEGKHIETIVNPEVMTV